jgi:hypothetical protein
MVSPMVILIVLVVPLLNANRNVLRVCLIVRLIEMILVGILVLRVEVGRKELIREFIGISEQLRHLDNGWDSALMFPQEMLDYPITAPD